MKDISRGSLVRLRAGLPDSLRVLGIYGDGQAVPAGRTVAVAWLGGDGLLRRAVLPMDALEPSPATTTLPTPPAGDASGRPAADH